MNIPGLARRYFPILTWQPNTPATRLTRSL